MKSLPLLPLRDIVVFPSMVVPLYVGRGASIAAVEAAMAADRELLLASQRQARVNEPSPKDIYTVGTVAKVVQHVRRPDGTIKVLVEGLRRAEIEAYRASEPYFRCDVRDLVDEVAEQDELPALQKTVRELFAHYAKLTRRVQNDVLEGVLSIQDPRALADAVVGHLSIKHEDKQALLEALSPNRRLEMLAAAMQAELEILQVERKIRNRVKKQMERSEKEYYLNEQMRAIQKELGDRDEFKNELGELDEALGKKNMPEAARSRVEKELKKLRMMSPMSAEATVLRNYIDWCLALPWDDVKNEKVDLGAATRILDEDHYGLDKPKERILEHLAVQTLVDRLKGPILCLVGPPGVGKTSLARSIARATGRDFVRQSLGGVRDEAEIRGHRRTYIGALPGKIIQSLKRAGSSNPLFLLDEIDKMSMDFRGDPSSALLEVLDPEQNGTFMDHYLDLEYDLSRIMFLCTANSLQGIPPALEDRLEIIRIAGYTDLEKQAIAEQYLIPKQRRENGIGEVPITWQPEATRTIMDLYTREAGVRTLEREIAGVCRKLAKQVVAEGVPDAPVLIDGAKAKALLGVPKFRRKKSEETSEVGLATGLAWTQNGGEILHIEVSTMPGKGKLTVTGKLGDVMQESAQAAMSYVRSRAGSWGLAPDFYQNVDLHIHVPEGAMPKDGPSAGITMTTALISALTGIPVRHDVAMTGEITLRGRVLPIGGLKEKSLAAARAELKVVILPKENEKDLEEVPGPVRDAITFVPVEHLDEVLRHALSLDDADSFFAEARASMTAKQQETAASH